MPWQLLSAGYFSSYRPLSFIPDLQLGASLRALARALGAEDRGATSLLRVTTYGYVLDLSRSPALLTPLRRMRPLAVELSRARLERSGALAERHLLGAQLQNGRFRYTLEPFTGAADEQGFNLARQAGALLALCELGRSVPEVDSAVMRGLGVFRDFERRAGPLSALSTDPAATRVRLGESGLPLVSLLACGSRVGPAFDELIARLARYLLAVQLPDGSFARHFDLPTGTAVADMQPLYASGQAVLSLLLLEKRQRASPSPDLPSLPALSDAAERAMSYFANDYWTHPLRDFFFLEENWHCLAAREALSVHRHAAYEDFCWDYVTFKARLILDARDGVDPEFDGGFGFGNVVPPHNTGAAGFVEALAAALAVRSARGEAEPEARQLLGRAMRFVLRQQWTEDNCFACADARVLGGMSEHTHSALTRIDFAQHAWAGLGHGGRVLGLLD
jgi:hypothetical protein